MRYRFVGYHQRHSSLIWFVFVFYALAGGAFSLLLSFHLVYLLRLRFGSPAMFFFYQCQFLGACHNCVLLFHLFRSVFAAEKRSSNRTFSQSLI